MKKFLFLVFVCMFCVLPCTVHADEAMSKDAINREGMDKEAMRAFILDTIRENPQVLLDILRSNSIAILDIAQEGSNKRRINTLKEQWKKDLTVKKSMHCNDRPVYGNKDAKVRIVAFSDFTCHYCYSSKATVEKILDEYKDRISFIYKSSPMIDNGPSATAAAWFLAIAKQDQEKAWKFYNEMFEGRDTLQSDGISFIRKTAQKLKLNMAKAEKDAKNDKKIKTLLREDRDDADSLNVEGTPCFYVNNIVVRGAVPYEFFKIAIDMALKDVE